MKINGLRWRLGLLFIGLTLVFANCIYFADAYHKGVEAVYPLKGLDMVLGCLLVWSQTASIIELILGELKKG